MKREILFRAKCFGKWRYGSYVHFDKKPTHNCFNCNYKDFIVTNEVDGAHYYPITDLSSIGQYTGLKDKNGKKIFEGDIVRLGDDLYYFTFNIEFGSFMAARVKGSSGILLSRRTIKKCGYAVIGNIFDNPELLKQQRQ